MITAKEIRNHLKKAGFNSRQISVRAFIGGYMQEILIDIKKADINKRKIEMLVSELTQNRNTEHSYINIIKSAYHEDNSLISAIKEILPKIEKNECFPINVGKVTFYIGLQHHEVKNGRFRVAAGWEWQDTGIRYYFEFTEQGLESAINFMIEYAQTYNQ